MNDIPLIFDNTDGQDLRINMIGSWLKRTFEKKIVKLSLDGGFTCPNRDGSKGVGGCLFCSDSGSGDMASSLERLAGGADISSALEEQIQLLSEKWPKAGYLAYFQSHTNTYAPAGKLRELFTAALQHPAVMGLAVATRPDCLSEEALDLLAELNQQTFLWVELGLQTMHDETARAMNLCHSRADYEDAVRRLHDRGIRTVTHLILGLPGETKEMMLDSVRHVCRPLEDTSGNQSSAFRCVSDTMPNSLPASHLFGLKLHMLNVVSNSALPLRYPDYDPFPSIDAYTDLVIEALELIPPDITIHRISGDAPRPVLLAPAWSWRKRTILNEIHHKMRERNTWQGRRQGE